MPILTLTESKFKDHGESQKMEGGCGGGALGEVRVQGERCRGTEEDRM